MQLCSSLVDFECLGFVAPPSPFHRVWSVERDFNWSRNADDELHRRSASRQVKVLDGWSSVEIFSISPHCRPEIYVLVPNCWCNMDCSGHLMVSPLLLFAYLSIAELRGRHVVMLKFGLSRTAGHWFLSKRISLLLCPKGLIYLKRQLGVLFLPLVGCWPIFSSVWAVVTRILSYSRSFVGRHQVLYLHISPLVWLRKLTGRWLTWRTTSSHTVGFLMQ